MYSWDSVSTRELKYEIIKFAFTLHLHNISVALQTDYAHCEECDIITAFVFALYSFIRIVREGVASHSHMTCVENSCTLLACRLAKC